MKRFLPWGAWAIVAAGGVLAAASCGGNDETLNPLTTGTGGHGGSGGGGTGGTAGGGMGGNGAGGVEIPGLSAPVSVLYDQYGVVHIACKTDDDCYAALGYMHASNRFFFMDFVRNSVRGSLGGLVKAGDTVLQQDYANRRFFTTKDGAPLEKALYDQASAPIRSLMDSYTKGVNAWIDDMRAKRNGATLTDEYDFSLIVKSAIRDWEPEDSAAVGLYVLNDLSNDAQTEIAVGGAVPLFPPALGADLFDPSPVFDAFTVPSAMMSPPPSAPGLGSDAIARLAPHRALLASAGEGMRLLAGGAHGPKHLDEQGSNNWIAGPSRSASGHALLANDPHLLLGNPSIWFPVELDAKSNGGTGDYHVAGSTFPGLPSVMIGHNESIAWGVTTAYYDLDDVYLESLTNDNAKVHFNGGTVPLTTKTYKFTDVSHPGTMISQTFKWVPHHGPLVSEDDTAHTGVSIRWRGHDGGQDLDAFFGLARAGSVADAKSALKTASSANQNFVVIDKAGQIAWLPYAKVPTRPWASPSLPPWLPLPGDGTAEWGAAVPYANLPQLENPPLGAIATANNDMTGDWADGNPFNNNPSPALQSAYKADGTREQRILDLLNAGGNAHSVDTFSAMQGDTHSLYGEFVVAALEATIDPTGLPADQRAVFDALTAWQFTCPTGLAGDDPGSPKSPDATESRESIGCTAFHVTFYAIVEQALGDEVAAACGTDAECAGAMNGGITLNLVARALKNPASVTSGALLWDDVSTAGTTEAESDILLRSLARAASVLANIGATSDDWRWGKVHTLSLQSIYANFGLTMYNYGPYAAPGGLFTVNVANPDGTLPTDMSMPDMSFTHGPSVRFLVEAKPTGPVMKFELPGGEDLHRDSPFYNNLLPRWLHNQPVDFAFGPGAVKNPAKKVDISPAP